MELTELEIATLERPLQFKNARSRKVVTELGMVMLVKPIQSSNALEPIVVTEFGIIVFLQPRIRDLPDFLMIALQLSRESYFELLPSTVMLDKLVQ